MCIISCCICNTSSWASASLVWACSKARGDVEEEGVEKVLKGKTGDEELLLIHVVCWGQEGLFTGVILGVARLTSMILPSTVEPCSTTRAVSASSPLAIVTNPNPLEPLSL